MFQYAKNYPEDQKYREKFYMGGGMYGSGVEDPVMAQHAAFVTKNWEDSAQNAMMTGQLTAASNPKQRVTGHIFTPGLGKAKSPMVGPSGSGSSFLNPYPWEDKVHLPSVPSPFSCAH